MFTTMPGCVSITQPTERGAVYTSDELAALGALADEFSMHLHIDGARLHAAAAKVGLLAAVGPSHIVSLGGTKNGMACGEAVVCRSAAAVNGHANRAEHAARLAKQQCQVLSKHRFVAAQWIGYLADGAWLHRARHANECAALLAEGIARLRIPGVQVQHPETNQVFVEVPCSLSQRVRRSFALYEWDEPRPGTVTLRACCSCATDEDDVAKLVAAVAAAA
eukprot:TRINITY_DN6739_c0_g1_i2.p1 TRINITY_DN6739_c0_g1~~TRINITY_DN6739_c0_g1_i2.p1  ORF type:complete len:221 (+),score=59.06 TRINITY_DN6739_c0_g1_i2:382-1044(+)